MDDLVEVFYPLVEVLYLQNRRTGAVIRIKVAAHTTVGWVSAEPLLFRAVDWEIARNVKLDVDGRPIGPVVKGGIPSD